MSGNTLLLIEDEEMVRNSVGRILHLHGFKVITASDGREGINLFAEHQQEIGLVVLDWILPRLGGGEVLEELKRLDPEVRVVVFSGHEDCMSCTQADVVLRKPLDVKVFIYQLERFLRRQEKSRVHSTDPKRS